MSKRLLIGVILVTVCLGLLNGCSKTEDSKNNSNQQNTISYTNNKPVGKNTFRDHAFVVQVRSYKDLLESADLIVEGEVISEGEHAYDGWPKVEGTPDDHELNRKDKVDVTLTKFKVTKVLYGKLDSDIITVYQYGPANTDIGELKVEKGQKLVCFLRLAEFTDGREFKNLYASVGWEDGFYDITDENSMRAFSNVNVLCKYDGKPSSEFIKEIESVIKKYNEQNPV